VSTIKVDTYLTRGGASEIAIDKLKGASSAGSMTVIGEGGSTTTNLQQGLAKFWMNYHSGTTINDSFNSTSLTDNGTGDYTMTIANDMANATYAVHHTSSDANTNASVIVPVIQGSSLTTTLFKVYLLNEDVGVSDGSDPNAVSVLGDLA
jgi:hypothetical protein